MKIMTSWQREAQKAGRKKGRQEGASGIVFRLLSERFGELGEAIASQVQALSAVQLEELAVAIQDLVSLDDLSHWLAERAQTGVKSPRKTPER